MNLLEKAKRLAAQQHDSPQRVLIHGDSGTGKTTLVAQLAKKYNLHLFDLDAGHNVIYTAVPQQYWGNVNVYEVEDLPDNSRAAKLIDKAIRPETITTFCTQHGEVGCSKCKGKETTTFNTAKLTPNDIVVIDAMTTLSKSASNFSVGSAIMGGDMAYFKLEFTHHDKQGMILSNFLQRMKQLPCHVVVITHSFVLDNMNGTKQIAPIGGTKNFAKTCVRDFDHVVYCYLKNNKHCFTSSTTHAPGIVAKSRTNVDIQTTDDIFKLFATDIIHAAATPVQFEKDSTGGPDEVAGGVALALEPSAAVVEAVVTTIAQTPSVIKQTVVLDSVIADIDAATEAGKTCKEDKAVEQVPSAAPAVDTAPAKRTIPSGAMLALQARLGKKP